MNRFERHDYLHRNFSKFMLTFKIHTFPEHHNDKYLHGNYTSDMLSLYLQKTNRYILSQPPIQSIQPIPLYVIVQFLLLRTNVL